MPPSMFLTVIIAFRFFFLQMCCKFFLLHFKRMFQITYILDELMDRFMDICAESKWGVIITLVRLARNKDEVSIIKKLRDYFRCRSRSARRAFVPCVYSLTRRTPAKCIISTLSFHFAWFVEILALFLVHLISMGLL